VICMLPRSGAKLICVSHDAYFVDLFVRKSNSLAIDMYRRLGYSVYRCVRGYYTGGGKELDEDAYGMSTPEDTVLTKTCANPFRGSN
jgi:ribosomal protein S18 acetylase RimI-like enzyme